VVFHWILLTNRTTTRVLLMTVVSFILKNKETKENYFFNVDFYERKKFESK
jgi:hypothetical protein